MGGGARSQQGMGPACLPACLGASPAASHLPHMSAPCPTHCHRQGAGQQQHQAADGTDSHPALGPRLRLQRAGAGTLGRGGAGRGVGPVVPRWHTSGASSVAVSLLAALTCPSNRTPGLPYSLTNPPHSCPPHTYLPLQLTPTHPQDVVHLLEEYKRLAKVFSSAWGLPWAGWLCCGGAGCAAFAACAPPAACRAPWLIPPAAPTLLPPTPADHPLAPQTVFPQPL